MLGGWVLIGVTDQQPNEGLDGGWHPVAPTELTDRVREMLRQVDPLPPFAATVMEHEESGKRIGLVRVYESADAPHVMRTGHVFVRSVAQDKNVARAGGDERKGPRYTARAVDTQSVLRALVERGTSALTSARRLLQPPNAPLTLSALGLATSGQQIIAPTPVVAMRAAPLTPARLADWAVSRRARSALEAVARQLARRAEDIPVDVAPAASGLTVRARTDDYIAPADGLEPRGWSVAAVTDAAGAVGASLQFWQQDPPRDKTRLDLNGLRDIIILPLLRAVATILAAGELYGRCWLDFYVGLIAPVFMIDDTEGLKEPPFSVPLGAELTLPLDPESDELSVLANQLRDGIGRAAGYMTLRP